MKHFGSIENDAIARLLRWLVLVTGALVVAFAVFGVFSFSLSKIAVLAVALFVAALISKYEIRIPETEVVFSPKSLFAFWGVIWLGGPGGILLGAAASFAGNRKLKNGTQALLTNVSADILCILISAFVYYTTFDVVNTLQSTGQSGNILIPNEVLFSSVSMAFTHYCVSAVFASLLYRIESARLKGKLLRDVFVLPAAASAISLVATIILFVTFNHFGIEFGLVIVPLAVIGNLAYKIHWRSLEHKTKLITEASRMHLATVEALATAIDARDQVGVGHVRRTQIYALGIGNILGLGEDDIDALRTGALLHDIGKLAVPDHILNKPGKLTHAEMEKIKIHSSVGASILEKVGFPYPVIPTVKYHHEFWDGSGYPEQLRGNMIPLTARILTVADAYDTLRGARPYRPAVAREEACNFLRAGAGTQFDPKIVSTFLRNLKTFEDEIAAEGLEYERDSRAPAEAVVYTEDGASPNYVEQIKRANREVFTLYSLARDFSSSLNMRETLSLFTEKAGELVPFETCAVYLLDNSGEYADAVFVDGKNESAIKGRRIKVGEGPTGLALKKCKPVRNMDPALDFALADLEVGKAYTAMASLPLVADEKLIGAVSLYSQHLSNYQDEHLRLLETISLIAADAICNSLQHTAVETHALTDPMTGLPNARSLQIEFEKEVKRAARSGNSFQVLVLDLDGFKAVNDTFGHKIGDKMLKEISAVIRNQLRDYDFLARYGGDEFVAIVPETESGAVVELCRRIEEAVGKFVLRVGEDDFAKVGVSLGAASYPHQGESFDQIVIAADKSMYQTKSVRKQLKKRKEVEAQAAIHASVEPADIRGREEEIALHIEADIVDEIHDDELIVELDLTHIISSYQH